MESKLEPKTCSLGQLGLNDIVPTTWALLQDGARRAGNPFHTGCLATMSHDGPSQRTVVLRHVTPTQRLVACHTDRRSTKVHELLEDPRASWLFYDTQRKLQVRLAGAITLHTDDTFADACWAGLAPRSRACYHTTWTPGQSTSAPPAAPSSITNAAEEQNARGQFVVVACRVTFLDWLSLSAGGHRRAQFHLRDEHFEGSWIAP